MSWVIQNDNSIFVDRTELPEVMNGEYGRSVEIWMAALKCDIPGPRENVYTCHSFLLQGPHSVSATGRLMSA